MEARESRRLEAIDRGYWKGKDGDCRVFVDDVKAMAKGKLTHAQREAESASSAHTLHGASARALQSGAISKDAAKRDHIVNKAANSAKHSCTNAQRKCAQKDAWGSDCLSSAVKNGFHRGFKQGGYSLDDLKEWNSARRLLSWDDSEEDAIALDQLVVSRDSGANGVDLNLSLLIN